MTHCFEATTLLRQGIITLSTETRGTPYTLVMKKTAKEVDVAKRTALQDDVTIAELTGVLAMDAHDQERATKRRKIDHNEN